MVVAVAMPRTPFALLLLALAPACTSSHFALGAIVRPDGPVAVRIQGEAPRVRIQNDGPGTVDVEFANAAATERLQLARGSHARTLQGGGLVRVALTEGTEAQVKVDVEGGTGFDLRQPSGR